MKLRTVYRFAVVVLLAVAMSSPALAQRRVRWVRPCRPVRVVRPRIGACRVQNIRVQRSAHCRPVVAAANCCCVPGSVGSLLPMVASSVDAAPATPAKPAGPKWVNLFDGKTLTGWKKTNFGGEGDVSVKDGSIFMDYGADLTGVNLDKWPLSRVNYEVELEGQRVEGQDFFVGVTFPVKDTYCSLILGGWGGGVCGISSIDSYDASENETTSYENFKVGQWYKVRFQVTDGRIKAWLDGKELVDLETEGKKLSVRFEVEPCQPFGLCAFQTQAAIRNLRAREIAAPQTASGQD